ncbi:hypothetical protein TNCV_622331 [Trichonephila clavipes]|nr:hypothetical protein TNCV_622331 [Trichonephila clavipes]
MAQCVLWSTCGFISFLMEFLSGMLFGNDSESTEFYPLHCRLPGNKVLNTRLNSSGQEFLTLTTWVARDGVV